MTGPGDTTGVWLLSDVDGNVATLLRDDGTVLQQRAYSPYGRVDGAGTATSPDPTAPGSELGFQTAITDPDTGRVLLGPRQYDPELARFTTTDYFPTATADTTLGIDPLTSNRFRFAAANPVAWHDNGHRPCWDQPGRCGLPGPGPGHRAAIEANAQRLLAATNAVFVAGVRASNSISDLARALGSSTDAARRTYAARELARLRHSGLNTSVSRLFRNQRLQGLVGRLGGIVTPAVTLFAELHEDQSLARTIGETATTTGGTFLGGAGGSVAAGVFCGPGAPLCMLGLGALGAVGGGFLGDAAGELVIGPLFDVLAPDRTLDMAPGLDTVYYPFGPFEPA